MHCVTRHRAIVPKWCYLAIIVSRPAGGSLWGAGNVCSYIGMHKVQAGTVDQIRWEVGNRIDMKTLSGPLACRNVLLTDSPAALGKCLRQECKGSGRTKTGCVPTRRGPMQFCVIARPLPEGRANIASGVRWSHAQGTCKPETPDQDADIDAG
jgi:hypothetical protein